MSTFGLTVGSNETDVIGAINYALSNISSAVPSTLVANTSTGIVGTANGFVLVYLYQYLGIAFSPYPGGVNPTTGQSDISINGPFVYAGQGSVLYYGLINTQVNTINKSTSAADYIWYTSALNLLTYTVWYTVPSRYVIDLYIGTNSPGPGWQAFPTAGNSYVDLVNEVVTNSSLTALTANTANTAQYANNAGYAGTATTALSTDRLNPLTINGYGDTYVAPILGFWNRVTPNKNTVVDNNFNYSYVSTSTVTNTLTVPNITLNRILTLQPQHDPPDITVIPDGSICMAAGIDNGWSPVNFPSAGRGPYPVIWLSGYWWEFTLRHS